jgi:hypothetical protein
MSAVVMTAMSAVVRKVFILDLDRYGSICSVVNAVVLYAQGPCRGPHPCRDVRRSCNAYYVFRIAERFRH